MDCIQEMEVLQLGRQGNFAGVHDRVHYLSRAQASTQT
jgi:hypothetical protein